MEGFAYDVNYDRAILPIPVIEELLDELQVPSFSQSWTSDQGTTKSKRGKMTLPRLLLELIKAL